MKKRQKHTTLSDINLGIIGSHLIIPDPMGSYTGVPADKTDVPVQDADDL